MNWTEELLQWYDKAKRILPWRDSGDPYRIWLSEIMLQQTRVEQGIPYFLRFTERFPSVFRLAEAEEQEVLKFWEGLGYYSRARNLHKAAKLLAAMPTFPTTAAMWQKLPGVGRYTSGAIASIAFQECVPAVDGNVFRVISRLFAIPNDISKPATLKIFEALLLEIMPKSRPGDFNQALMELGATVCSPRQPNCSNCPIAQSCEAAKSGNWNAFPVKLATVKSRQAYLAYIKVEYQGKQLWRKRPEGGIWAGLWEPYGFDSETVIDFEFVEKVVLDNFLKHQEKASIQQIAPAMIHVLTHRKLFASFWGPVFLSTFVLPEGYQWIEPEQVANLPKSRLIMNVTAAFLQS